MTLANFKSNFRWQLRALKQSRDCCIGPPPPPPTPCFCYEIIGITGTCTVEYIDCAGIPQRTTSGRNPVYVCAQEGTVNPICIPPFTSASVSGGTIACTDDVQCQPVIRGCYFYSVVKDSECVSFNPQTYDWILNGVSYFSGNWPSLMQNPPYGAIGNGVQYSDSSFSCGPGANSNYCFWTLVDPTILTLPPLTGNDSIGNPVSFPMLGPICDRKCYEGTFTTSLGSVYVIGFNSAEINATDYSIIVDLSSPTASNDLTTQLRYFYPPSLNATVNVIGPDEYTIRITGVYSLGTYIDLYMDDYLTVPRLDEIPC